MAQRPSPEPATPTATRLVWRPRDGRLARRPDHLAVEEPLEIRLGSGAQAAPRVLTVTMRTPGHDFELATGWLLAEGLISDPDDLRAVRYCTDPSIDGEQRYNVVSVDLAPGALERHLASGGAVSRLNATSSSCGVCGTASIEAIASRMAGGPRPGPGAPRTAFAFREVVAWPGALREVQAGFSETGGLHAAGLFSGEGGLLVAREDIGRHNAVDKVIGWAVQQAAGGTLGFPLTGLGLVVSGRTSFEIVQKAVAAGIPLIVGVSAASSLAARLADEQGLTVVGFARNGSGTVYTHPDRLEL
jgi:FdhD protein